MLSSFSKESGMAFDKLVFVWVLSLVMNLRLGYMVTPQMSRAGPWTMNTLIKPDQGNCQTMASSNFFPRLSTLSGLESGPSNLQFVTAGASKASAIISIATDPECHRLSTVPAVPAEDPCKRGHTLMPKH